MKNNRYTPYKYGAAFDVIETGFAKIPFKLVCFLLVCLLFSTVATAESEPERLAAVSPEGSAAAAQQGESPPTTPDTPPPAVAIPTDSTLEFVQSLAGELEKNEDWLRAAQVYQHLHERFPEDLRYRFKNAQMLAFGKEYDLAVERLKAMNAEYPDFVDGRMFLARVEAWRGNWVQADEILRTRLAEDPKDMNVYLIRGDILFYQNRFEEAARQYEYFLMQYPQDAEALRSAARAYLAQGDTRRAERLAVPLKAAGDVQTAQTIRHASAADTTYRVDVAPTLAINIRREAWQSLRASLLVDLTDDVALGGGLDMHHRGDLGAFNASLFALGGFRLHEMVNIDLELGFTPSSDFLPAFYGRLIGRFPVTKYIQPYVTYGIVDYKDAAAGDDDLLVNQLGPGFVIHAGILSLDLAYKATFFNVDVDVGHLITGAVHLALPSDWWIFAGAGFGKGTEVFFDPTAIVQDVLTIHGGIGYRFNSHHSLRGIYTFLTTDPEFVEPEALYQHGMTLHYSVLF